MKKIFIAVAVMAMATMAACGGKEAVQKNETALKDKIENCTNPDSMSVYVDQAKAYAQKLVQEGKIDEAKKYLDELTPVIQSKAPALASTLNSVKEALAKVPCAADSAKCAAAQACDSAKACAEQKAAEAVQKGKDAAAEAVQKGKDAASKAANDAASKAADAINDALKK